MIQSKTDNVELRFFHGPMHNAKTSDVLPGDASMGEYWIDITLWQNMITINAPEVGRECIELLGNFPFVERCLVENTMEEG